MSKKIDLYVTTKTQALRIDVFLSQSLEDVSRSSASKIIANKLCYLNSKLVTKASTFVQHGDFIEVDIPTAKELSPVAEDIQLNIIYEDNDIIVINKDFGMVVHPSAGHPNHTLVNALLYHCEHLSMGFHEHRPGIVHRLDKDTGGLIVVAKNQKAHTHLARQFHDKTAGRTYTAISFHPFKSLKGSFESHLVRHPKNRLKFASSVSKTGKWAKTHFKVLYNGPVCVIELDLETGRTHQIRVHLSENNHPIVNDVLYSHKNFLNNLSDARLKSILKKTDHMFLFAHRLRLIHPVSQKSLDFTAELPKSFLDLISFLNAESKNI